MSEESNVEKKLNMVDRSLTVLERILKKHWKVLILISIGGFIYWAFTLPPAEEQENIIQDSAQENTQFETDSIDE